MWLTRPICSILEIELHFVRKPTSNADDLLLLGLRTQNNHEPDRERGDETIEFVTHKKQPERSQEPYSEDHPNRSVLFRVCLLLLPSTFRRDHHVLLHKYLTQFSWQKSSSLVGVQRENGDLEEDYCGQSVNDESILAFNSRTDRDPIHWSSTDRAPSFCFYNIIAISNITISPN